MAFDAAIAELAAACRACDEVLARLPAKPRRGEAEAAAAEAAKQVARRECLARNPDARIIACVSAYE